MNVRLPSINVWNIMWGLCCKRVIELSLPQRCPKLENYVVRGMLHVNYLSFMKYAFSIKIVSQTNIYQALLNDSNHWKYY